MALIDPVANHSPALADGAGFERVVACPDTPDTSDPPQARTVDVKRFRGRVRGTLLALDMLAIAAGLALADWVRADAHFDALAPPLIAIMTVLYGGLALANHVYDAASLTNLSRGIRSALTSLVIAALLAMGLGFALRMADDYSRLAAAIGFVGTAVLFVLSRLGVRRWVRNVAPHGLIHRVRFCHGVDCVPEPGEELIDAGVLALEPRLDCPATLDQIGHLLSVADEIIVSCRPEDRPGWSAALKGLGVRVEMEIPEIADLGIIGDHRRRNPPTVLVGRGPLNTGDEIIKRAFDLAVVLMVLPVLVPLTGLIALLIKLEDGGPVLFAQRRIGQGNRLFKLYKFRSMRVAALDADGTVSTARRDARVTRIGRLLRATSLDELPQLYNVLLGDMSVVGPRPHAMASRAGDRLFWDVDHRYWWRHAAKPGLTGLAQVRGFRGATDTADDLRNRVLSDLEYLEGWTLWRDVAISVATLKVILHPKAY